VSTTETKATEAEERFRELLGCLEEEPRDVDLLIRTGNAALELSRRPEAYLYFSRALELDPSQRHLLPKIRAVAEPEDLPTVMKYARRPGTFAEGLKGVFQYPFRGAGLGMLILGSLFFYGIRVVASINFFPLVGVFVGVIVFGYLAMWLMDVAKKAAYWEDDPPHWPDPSMWTELLTDWAKIVSAQVVAFLPLILMTGYLASTQATGLFDEAGDPDLVGRWDAGFVVFLLSYYVFFALVGFAYLPMALMANALLGTPWAAWNPVFVVRSLLRIPREYALCAVVFAGTWIGSGIVEMLIMSHELALFLGPIVTFLEIYVMVVQMRMLGLLYGIRQTRLAWFR